jgi:hypothetical protein
MNREFEEQLKTACLDGEWHLAIEAAIRKDATDARKHGFVTSFRRRSGSGHDLYVKRLRHQRAQDRLDLITTRHNAA